MYDVRVEYLIYNLQDIGLKEDDIYLLLQRLEGYRLYIKNTDILRYRIKKRYNNLKSVIDRADIVKTLSNEFRRSANAIRAILKKIDCDF
jgi:hypothetical protein